MDFIKTSSLRALIELTFQRNWNGLIWMSRKGVTTKRVKTVQTALSRISAQPRSPAGRGTNVPRSAKYVRPSEVSAKVQTVGRSRNHDPGKLPAVGHATTAHATPRTTRREPGKTLASGRDFIGQISSVRPRRPTVNPSGHDRSDSATTRLSGRSSRPTVPTPRSTRSPFEAQISYFQARLNPKPPLKDLALYI
ncbi:unnamed protein product [Microthlaspi erraticum]|uniref:Uncharacterized protein n=1 Tax=Microthlaspi erraticum TaxID=1685480 RepID=A0A6D2J3X4_9BRAS|nr:unnamed protein product [Microthlaspi erraticum]